MSYKFTPMSEEEMESFSLIEDGIYDFEVIQSIPKTSKSGNQMSELIINVWDNEGKIHPIYDYLVFSSVPLNIRKVKHFCDAVGLQEEYKKGEIPEELINRSGKVHIGIKAEQPNPNGGNFPKKNIVINYIMTNKDPVKYTSPSSDGSKELNDDVPF
jgi:hypothetical protein